MFSTPLHSRLTTLGCVVVLCAAAAPVAVATQPRTEVRTMAASVPAEAQEDERTAIAERARAALTTPLEFRLTAEGETLLSRPGEPEGNNYLGQDGSNTDRNTYNDFNGLAWCGYFAADMWDHEGVPEHYRGSQSWRTSLGERFHAYASDVLPQVGDVLVWTNQDNAAQGHVGVVVEVSGTTVTTVEGNTGHNSDSVSERTYEWDGAGPVHGDKLFRGFASRF
ncbi:CHAP domain-containing protein [Streptomyces sp. NPDC048639]|uniref:CHAP domain-containing protein n=1 Tax=Streptomyces sp. NPDC048639 TaxID=3365581 RepID=UPI00371B566E